MVEVQLRRGEILILYFHHVYTKYNCLLGTQHPYPCEWRGRELQGRIVEVSDVVCMADVSDPSYHALGFSNYIFNAGYMNQQWTDVQILFFDTSIKLHRSETVHVRADTSRLVPKSVSLTGHAKLSTGRFDPPQLSG